MGRKRDYLNPPRELGEPGGPGLVVRDDVADLGGEARPDDEHIRRREAFQCAEERCVLDRLEVNRYGFEVGVVPEECEHGVVPGRGEMEGSNQELHDRDHRDHRRVPCARHQALKDLAGNGVGGLG